MKAPALEKEEEGNRRRPSRFEHHTAPHRDREVAPHADERPPSEPGPQTRRFCITCRRAAANNLEESGTPPLTRPNILASQRVPVSTWESMHHSLWKFLRFVRFGRVSSANSPKERKEYTATDPPQEFPSVRPRHDSAPISTTDTPLLFLFPSVRRSHSHHTHTHHHASPRKKLSRSQGRRPQQQPSSLPGPAKPNTHNSSLSLKIYAIIDCCLPLASSPTSHSSRPPQLGRFEIAHSSMGGFSPRRPSVVASLYGES